VDGLAVPSTEPYTARDWEEQSKKYAAMIHMVDLDVGRIVEQIDGSPHKKNTLVIFTSDNGGHASVSKRFNTSGPLRGFKRDLTEGGIRVPFIARWPEVTPGNRTNKSVIAFSDMLPTFAELAGVNPPAGIDGKSVIAELKGHQTVERSGYLYWDYGHCRRRYDQAVRWKNWKAIRHGARGPIQLYDLGTDIGEERDVATSHPAVVNHVAEIMKTAPTPSARYPIGQIYRGQPIWKPRSRSGSGRQP
jgi:arylsulfatase A-like enzyme